ncbi:hypothetical protein PSI15_10795 [Xenorhabdus sp. PR6a]|uniref:hypothetical protein n=1 Tax=Xenorhabdus sp. PR6a TaxID=3025877 RepID=UPI0023583554|nr:hypothetical protein [Xenorhabdus sp. PR6a]MDC9582045.1 hypothetical protein [Xenorhabdus sp. PR6a]
MTIPRPEKPKNGRHDYASADLRRRMPQLARAERVYAVSLLAGRCTARVSVSELRAQRLAPAQNIIKVFVSKQQ